MTDQQWQDYCESIAQGLREQAANLERHKPEHIGVLQIRVAADYWQRLSGNGEASR